MPSAESITAIDLLTSVSPISQNPKPFSISLSKPKASTQTTNPRKRPHSSLADESDLDHDVKDQKRQLVSSFDRSAGGAIGFESGNDNAKAPLVIIAQKNRDWRAESSRKRGRNLLPAEEIARREGRTIKVVEDAVPKPQVYGLTVVKKKNVEALEEDKESIMKELRNEEVVPSQPMTADEEAVAALMGERKRKELVLPAVRNEIEEGDIFTGRANSSGAYEEDTFKADVASRPDSASLDDYVTVPIEEFGAALLRGMGWKEGDVVGKRKDRVVKPRVLERRPQLLGLGAKEVPEGLEEIGGAWGKAAKGKKMPKGFTQMLLKNTKTGELLSEEELKARKEQQSVVVDDWRERRERNLKADEGKKEERREREREEERRDEGSRNTSSRRERSRSPDRRRDRRRDYKDQTDDSDRQDRDRERKRRDKERDSGRDREGERSSKYEHRSRRDYKYEQSDSRSSRDRQRERNERDDTRSRRRQEVY